MYVKNKFNQFQDVLRESHIFSKYIAGVLCVYYISIPMESEHTIMPRTVTVCTSITHIIRPMLVYSATK